MTHTGEKLYQCSYCVKSFQTNTGKKRHEKTHRPTAGKPYQCNSCGKLFKTTHGMKQHEMKKYEVTHTKEKLHSCSYCGKLQVEKKYMKCYIIGLFLSHAVISFLTIITKQEMA